MMPLVIDREPTLLLEAIPREPAEAVAARRAGRLMLALSLVVIAIPLAAVLAVAGVALRAMP